MTLPLTDLLLAHRARGTLIDGIAETLAPTDAAAAYQVQNETIAAIGPAGAWKVQPYPETGEPFTSPILKKDVYPSGAALKLSDYAGIAIEAEIAVTICRDLPDTSAYSPDDLRDAVASLHLAIEVVASRFVDRKANPSLVGIADLQNSGAVVVGPALAGEWPELSKQALSMFVDGCEVGRAAGNGSTENTLKSLAWLANHAKARGLPLKAGDVIITGARLGPLPLEGKEVVVTGPGFEPVTATFA